MKKKIETSEAQGESADFTFSDGRKLNFDLTKIEWSREYKGILINPDLEDDAKEPIIARACNMTPEEFSKLNIVDHWNIIRAFFVAVQNVMKNPNSRSASTEQ